MKVCNIRGRGVICRELPILFYVVVSPVIPIQYPVIPIQYPVIPIQYINAKCTMQSCGWHRLYHILIPFVLCAAARTLSSLISLVRVTVVVLCVCLSVCLFASVRTATSFNRETKARYQQILNHRFLTRGFR